LTAEAVAMLSRVRTQQGAIGDAWVFPALRGDRTKAMSANAAMNLFKQLAAAAGIPAGERYGWHSLRRKFASELRHVSLKELTDLGGWKSPATVLTCYVQSDEHAQREALADRRTPGKKAVSGVS
jgi:integrase